MSSPEHQIRLHITAHLYALFSLAHICTVSRGPQKVLDSPVQVVNPRLRCERNLSNRSDLFWWHSHSGHFVNSPIPPSNSSMGKNILPAVMVIEKNIEILSPSASAWSIMVLVLKRNIIRFKLANNSQGSSNFSLQRYWTEDIAPNICWMIDYICKNLI